VTDTFGDRVRELRNRKGWTQALLADRTGLSQTQVSDAENCNRAPRGMIVAALARGLGVSTDYLLGVKAK